MNQMVKALDIYALDHNGTYPPYSVWTWEGGHNINEFELALKPYLKINIMNDDVFGSVTTGHVSFVYKSPSSTEYKTYGIGLNLIDPNRWESNDGDYYWSYYELGSDVLYCSQTYSGRDANWIPYHNTNRCVGGN